MKREKADFFFLAPVAPLAICIVNNLMNQSPNISYYKCIILTAVIGLLVYGIIIISTLNVGNLSKLLYLKLRGFASLPIFVFPIYIYKNKSGKTRIKIVLEWSVFFRELFSQDLIKAYNSNCMQVERCYASAISVGFLSKIIFLLFAAIFCFAIYPDVLVLFVFSSFIILFFWIAKLDTYSFQGELKRNRDIRCGELIKYLAEEVCISDIHWSDKRKIYSAFIEWMHKSKEENKDINLKACVAKHIFIEEWDEKQSFLSLSIKEYVKDNILNGNKIGMGMFDETWELLKVFLAHSVLTQDSDSITHSVKELRSLKVRFGAYSAKFGDMIDWYIKVAYCMLSEEEINKHPLFSKRDRFCVIGSAYKDRAEKMELKLLEKLAK